LHNTEPLLKTVVYLGLLDLAKAEDLEEAKELLADFRKNVPNIDNNGYALAYLFGIMQGTENTMIEFSRSKESFIQKLLEAHELGKRLGFIQAMLLLDSKEND